MLTLLAPFPQFLFRLNVQLQFTRTQILGGSQFKKGTSKAFSKKEILDILLYICSDFVVSWHGKTRVLKCKNM